MTRVSGRLYAFTNESLRSPKLSDAMSFAQYDKFTRTVYIQHMQAERNAYAIAEEKPPNTLNINRIVTYSV